MRKDEDAEAFVDVEQLRRVEPGEDRRATTPMQPVVPRRPTAAPPTAAPPRRTFARVSQAQAVQPAAADVKPRTTITRKATMSLPGTTSGNDSLGEVAAETEDPDMEGEEEEFDEERADEGAALQNIQESWRNRRIARGVPLHADSPRQTLQFPVIDQGLMLKERGKLTDAPEDQDNLNPLAKLGMKKTEFVYCGTDANLKAARRGAVTNAIEMAQDTDRAVITWTATGRLLTGGKMPPQKALPSSYLPQPPEHMRPRQPMTRAEVTEQRIIEAAGKPPPGKEWMNELNVASEEYMVVEQEELRQQAAAKRQQKRQQRRQQRQQYGGASEAIGSGSTTPANSMTPSNASRASLVPSQVASSLREEVSREHPRGPRSGQVRK